MGVERWGEGKKYRVGMKGFEGGGGISYFIYLLFLAKDLGGVARLQEWCQILIHINSKNLSHNINLQDMRGTMKGG